MNYNNFPNNVVILGAAGKMGSGITLLLAMEMTNINITSGKNLTLNALDISEEGLNGLLKYVEKQTSRKTEKKPDAVRKIYGDNVTDLTDEELAKKYSADVLSTIRTTTNLNDVSNAQLIFEAVNEDLELKAKLINIIKSNSTEKTVVFTNTSSIPINELEEITDLHGNILGFHFYNPPAVQRLVELITSKNTRPELVEFARTLAGNMKKIIVPSNDIAGFIGNGHFMRDLLFGLEKVDELSRTYSFSEAVTIVDTVSRNLLVRPMGILQLADYVGLDVCQKILFVMNKRIEKEDLHSNLLDSLIEKGIKGGQFSDGSQKNGLLKYAEGKITGVLNNEKNDYQDMPEVSEFIGVNVNDIPIWKDIIKSDDKDVKLKEYFDKLRGNSSLGAKLAIDYLKNSMDIGNNLVSDGVTDSPDHVNNVLLLGFYHAYGPINDFI